MTNKSTQARFWWSDATYALDLFDPVRASLEPAWLLVANGDNAGALEWLDGYVRDRLAAQADGLKPTWSGHIVPGSADEAERAERLLTRDEIKLLSSDYVCIGTPIDWRSGIETDDQWNDHLGYFYFVNPLARAYARTGDEAYAEKWCQCVEDFIQAVPYGSPRFTKWFRSHPAHELGKRTCRNGENVGYDRELGNVNEPRFWSSLNAAGRADAWMEGLMLLARSRALTRERLWRILASLSREHALCMVHNPRANTPNQYVHISATLVRFALFLPELREATPQLYVGLQFLEDAVTSQILPDGADMEQSPNYNWLVVSKISELLYLLRDLPANRLAFLRAAAVRRLRAMPQFLSPMGKTHDFAKAHHTEDLRPSVLAAAREFALDDVRWIMSAGAEGTPPLYTSSALAWGGWYALRSDWSENATQLLLKASARGYGHYHEDHLSLVLSHRGRRLLVDSGHYSYTDQSDLDRRMNAYGLQSRSHSTITADGLGQNRNALHLRNNPRSWETKDVSARTAQRLPNRLHEGGPFAYLEGHYADGYGPDGTFNLEHRRRVIWVRGYGFLVADLLTPPDSDAHVYTSRWMVGPDFAGKADISGGYLQAKAVDSPGLHIQPLCPVKAKLSLLEAKDVPETAGWYVVDYGQRVPKPDFEIEWSGVGPQISAAWIAPTEDDLPALTTHSTESHGNGLQLRLDFADGTRLDVWVGFTTGSVACLAPSIKAETVAHLTRHGDSHTFTVGDPEGDRLWQNASVTSFPALPTPQGGI